MMQNLRMIKSVINEYGISWAINRSIYNAKLKMLATVPTSERLFESKTTYPRRIDLFQIDVSDLRQFLLTMKEQDKAELLAVADNVAKGIIRGFSSVDLDYGYPIDWQLSPLTGKRCDERMKWFKIPDFDKERGDIKVICEASRFSHFVTLARAYLLTEDEKYYWAFSEQLDSWLKENPYSYGANFKCSQECSLRMVNALLSFSVFRETGITTKIDSNNVKDLIDRCYRKVLSNFFYAYRCIKNNHTISELMGMIVGAWCCGDNKQLKKAFHILDEVLDEQFTDDGGYRQFSFTYQRLALQDLECVLSIEHIVRKGLSGASRTKIRNAVLLMYQCQDGSGDMPNYGSNDGALAFPVTSCGYRDFRPVINTAYALTTGNQLYEDGQHQEELIWFSGGKKLSDYKREQIKRCSSQFPDAGLFTLRDKNSWVMVVFNDYQSRPAHLDQLHFDLWVNGVNVICDAGTYSYASDLGHTLVKNESHNTVKVDNINQMNTYGPFMVYDWTERRLGEYDDNSFKGEIVSKNGYSHTRWIEQDSGIYQIIDTITGKSGEKYTIRFHTPCEVECDRNTALFKWRGKTICTLKSDGNIRIEQSERSLFYLQKESTICLLVDGIVGNRTVIKTEITVKKGEKEND